MYVFDYKIYNYLIKFANLKVDDKKLIRMAFTPEYW